MYNSGRRGKRTTDNYGIISAADSFNQATYPIPIINSWSVTDGSYNPQQDLALLPAGGETVVLYGAGFTSGITVNINGVNISPVTLLDPNRVTFTSPALSAGTYTIYASNTDGATAIYLPGLQYAGAPTWTQPAAGSIGSMYETQNTRVVLAAANTTFVATAANTPITYAVTSGSLPTGATLSTSGILSGNTAIGSGSATTYTFTVTATNSLLETSTRTFSLTINPDVVTWTAPSQNGTLPVYEYRTPASLTATDAAGYGIVYTSNIATYNGNLALSSTGTWSGNVGPANSATANNNVYFLATATANTTGRFANSNVTMTIVPDVVTWSSPANNTTYTVIGGAPISNVTLSATSAAGFGIQYAANTLPTGISISGNTIYGTPTVAQTVNTLVTATANTSNRSTPIIINWSISLNDTFFNYTTLLLNGETTNTPFITDASTNNFGLTIQGDTKPMLFNPYQGGYYSTYFGGSSNYLTIPFNSNICTWWDNNYTIECWIYNNTNNQSGTNGLPLQVACGNAEANDTYWAFGTLSNGTLQFYYYNGGLITNAVSTVTVGLSTWTHIAMVYNNTSTNLTGYINGTQVFSVAKSGTPLNGNLQLNIGRVQATTYNGYISNLRIVKGTAVYTSAFTPSTTPLTAITNTSLLTCQSNRFIDNSTNAFALTLSGTPSISPNIPFTANSSYSTYGSAYFDGAGDYLTLPNNSSFVFGTGNFTIEFWCYAPAQGSTRTIFIGTDTSFAANFWGIQLNNTSPSISSKIQLWCYNMNSAAVTVAGSTTLTANTWYHVAVVRNGTAITIYLNGASDGTVTSSASLDGGVTQTINIAKNSTDYYTGYISDLRINKGTAVYTTAFTPPSAPLTAVANTQLLTCQTNGGVNNYGIIDNSPFNNIITRAGNSTQGTFSPYSQTGWSTYFNGSSTYVANATSTNNALGSGDYTIEFWCYSNSLGSGSAGSPFYVDMGGYQQLIRHNGSVYECYYKSGVGFTNVTIPTGNIKLNTWTHHALVRSSGVVKWFINGVLYGSAADTTNFTGSTYFQMGMYANYYYDGYVSNVRVVKGTAVYTTASTTIGTTIFTPPTSPLTPIAGTIFLSLQSNRFIDNGPLNTTITVTSTPSVQAYSPFGSIREAQPISYSSYLNGSSYVTVPIPSASDNLLGAGDYTIEFWVNTNDTSWEVFASEAGGLALIINAGSLLIQSTYGVAAILTISASAILNNIWHHVAVVRSSGTITIYFDGVSQGSVSNSTDYSAQTATYDIGYGNQSAGRYLTGYLSNFRVVNGTAVYTSNFTPPTSPLTAITNTKLLTFQNSTLIDNSPSARNLGVTGTQKIYTMNPFGYTAQTYANYTPSIHGGSCYLDGSGDYLTIPSSSSVPSTGNFTIETWVYPTSTSDGAIFYLLGNSGGYAGLRVGYTGYFYLLHSTNGTSWTVNSGNLGSVPINQWYHIAVTRNGNAGTLYINGVSTYTFTFGTLGSGSLQFIGAYQNTSYYYFTGYISDTRITNGTSLYTSNFVPPTQTLTNYSNSIPSSLLLNMNNGGIVDQHSSNVLETVGNAQVSTAVKKYGNASMSFNGTSQYLYSSPNVNYAMGTGDFTIEFWYYPVTHTNTTNPSLMANYNTTWTTNKFAFHAPHASYANKYSFWVNNYATGSAILVSTSNVTDGSWVHIAISRSGSTWKMFINGTVEATTTSTVGLDGGTAASMDGLWIGANFYTAETGRYINGYIDDLRITKGYARYTTNFTPPSQLSTR